MQIIVDLTKEVSKPVRHPTNGDWYNISRYVGNDGKVHGVVDINRNSGGIPGTVYNYYPPLDLLCIMQSWQE